MRIFISGATGVIGRRVIPSLLAQDHQVTAVGRTDAKRTNLEQIGADAVEVDLFSVPQVRSAVAGYDVIINLATSIPSTPWLFFPGAWNENDRLRRIVSGNIVKAAIEEDVGRVIQESFGLIYQDQGDKLINELEPLQLARHTRSVADAEGAVREYTESGRIGVALRFALFYGPDSSQTVEMINLARRGVAPMPGPGEGYVSSISHDDAATAVIAALNVPAGIYNVVDDMPLPRSEYFGSLAKVLEMKPPRLFPHWTRYLMGSVGETLSRSLRISNQKIRNASDWEPKFTSVREGWRDVIENLDS